METIDLLTTKHNLTNIGDSTYFFSRDVIFMKSLIFQQRIHQQGRLENYSIENLIVNLSFFNTHTTSSQNAYNITHPPTLHSITTSPILVQPTTSVFPSHSNTLQITQPLEVSSPIPMFYVEEDFFQIN